MSVSEERLLILKMLEEGKITSEDASKLLEALDSGTKKSSEDNTSKQQRQQANFQDEVFKVRQKVNDWRRDFKSNYNPKDFDRAVEDFSVKAEKVGKNLAMTTFGIVDKMIDFVGSFVDTNSFNIFGTYKVEERYFEAVAAIGSNLHIEGVNGQIVVKKHNEDKIIIKSKVRSPIDNADAILQFSNIGDNVSLKLNKIGNISVSHEILLPVLKFKNISFETSNARIYVEDTLSEDFMSITRNGHIELMGVNSEKVSINTKNAKIQISYVIGKDIDINTNNSVIDIKHIKTERIKAVTNNGRILVENAHGYDNSNEMDMELKTTNGGIKVNMNDMDNRGYRVKAMTTNGGVNLLIPEMQYDSINKQGMTGSFIEAESKNFDGYAEKVFINAETKNGYIEIVK